MKSKTRKERQYKKRICQICGKKKVCCKVHIDKDTTEYWCKGCRDEEESVNEGLNGFPQEHI